MFLLASSNRHFQVRTDSSRWPSFYVGLSPLPAMGPRPCAGFPEDEGKIQPCWFNLNRYGPSNSLPDSAPAEVFDVDADISTLNNAETQAVQIIYCLVTVPCEELMHPPLAKMFCKMEAWECHCVIISTFNFFRALRKSWGSDYFWKPLAPLSCRSVNTERQQGWESHQSLWWTCVDYQRSFHDVNVTTGKLRDEKKDARNSAAAGCWHTRSTCLLWGETWRFWGSTHQAATWALSWGARLYAAANATNKRPVSQMKDVADERRTRRKMSLPRAWEPRALVLPVLAGSFSEGTLEKPCIFWLSFKSPWPWILRVVRAWVSPLVAYLYAFVGSLKKQTVRVEIKNAVGRCYIIPLRIHETNGISIPFFTYI